MKKNEKKEILKKQYQFLSKVMPNEITFQNIYNEKNMSVDNVYCSILYLYEMPDEVSFGWDTTINTLLTKSGLENQVKIDIQQIQEDTAKKMLSKDLQNIETNYNAKSTYAISKQKEYAVKNQLVNEINEEQISLVNFVYRVYFLSTNQEHLNKKVSEFIIQANQKGYKFAYTLYNNKFNYKSKFNNLVDQQLDPFYAEKSLIVPSSVIALMHYNNGNSFYDENGVYIGLSNNQRIMFDCFKKTETRNSFSIAVFGDSGFGKSTLIKNLLLQRISLGDRALILDFEDEFGVLTDYCSGKNLDLKKDRFNPFQLFIIEKNEITKNEQEEINKLKDNQEQLKKYLIQIDKKHFETSLNNHITFLKEFIYILNDKYLNKSKSNLSFDTQIQRLLQKFYNEEQKLNHLNYSKIKPSDYLTLKDFIKFSLIEIEKLKTNMSLETEQQKNDIVFLEDIMENMLSNSTMLEYLSNRSNTTITDESILNYNLKELNSLNDKSIKLGVMYYLMYLTDSFILKNRSKNEDIVYDEKLKQNVIVPKKEEDREHMIIIIDEFHILLNYDFAINRLSELVRRARKYSSAIWLSTQSILDSTKSEMLEVEKLFSQIPTIFIGCQMTFDEEQLKKQMPAFRNAYGLHNIPNFKTGQFFAKIGKYNFIFTHDLGINKKEKEKIFNGGAGAISEK